MTDVKGCGRCCRHLGYPPFQPDMNGPTHQGVYLKTVEPLPANLQAEREALIRRRVAGLEEDRAVLYLPCTWLDQSTGLCGNYEHRPKLCREFDCSGRDDCHIGQWVHIGEEIQGCVDPKT